MSITVIYYATGISDCTVYELMKKNQSPHHAEWKLAKMIYLGQILSDIL